MKDWLKTWTIPQAIGAGVAMVCVTTMLVVITLHDDWGKLVRWLSMPESWVLLGGIVTGAATLYHRALVTPASALLLALGSTLVGCGAGITDAQRTAWTAEEARCEENIDAIVSRPGTTEAEDDADLAAEQARCRAAERAILQPDGGV